MPYRKESEAPELKTYLQTILDVESISDARKIADRALEFLEKFEKRKEEGEGDKWIVNLELFSFWL